MAKKKNCIDKDARFMSKEFITHKKPIVLLLIYSEIETYKSIDVNMCIADLLVFSLKNGSQDMASRLVSHFRLVFRRKTALKP